MIAKRSFLSVFFSWFFTPAEPAKVVPPSFVVEIGPTSGTKTLYQAKGLTSYCDEYIQIWKLDLPGKPTPPMSLEGNKVSETGTFEEIFGKISRDLNSLRVSQEQIMLFTETYPEKLRISGSTLILFTREDEPVYEDRSNAFVAILFIHEGVQEFEISEFANNYEWDQEHQTVTPQQ